MTAHRKTQVSKYMSYLLRHHPGKLSMDRRGFVDVDDLLVKLQERFDVDKQLIYELANGAGTRFEVADKKIRARYGHTIDVEIPRPADTSVDVLYHGTTPEAAARILRAGLKPMKRRWVHLSPTEEIARGVARRRTAAPVVLRINAEAARQEGLRFYRVTDTVFLVSEVPPRYVRRLR
jgi:putative RNA 2'-phosphotransferase